MVKVLKKFFMVVVSVFMVVVYSSAFSVTANAHNVGTPNQELRKYAVEVARIFDQHNKERTSRGISPLLFSTNLSLGLSQPYSNKVSIEEPESIKHNTRTELNKWGEGVGENLARSSREGKFTELWMGSEGHRNNILNPSYTIISFGYARGVKKYTATANFYVSSSKAGKTYRTGAEWLADFMNSPNPNLKPSNVNVYLTPGEHLVNGRYWRTTCEAYSQTQRCRTEIWATKIIEISGKFKKKDTWVFNNLTYAASSRSLWTGNPLAANGVVGGKVSWTAADGRQWRTECDTAVSGRNGCRSYSMSTVINFKNGQYIKTNEYVFNNIVHFS